jgi:hypothetical protein
VPKRVLAVILAAILVLSVGLQVVKLVDANPTWGTSATPIPPITDPPQIIIDSPSPTVYSNPVLLNLTIIQPNSWVTNRSITLPKSYEDNSDSVVVGQNKLKSITCVIDGQSIILWKGTPVGQGVTYYLPQITQFSAEMNLNKGQHTLQVNVLAVSEYVIEGIIPFAGKEYIISANQSTTFYLINGLDLSGSQTIYNIKSSYEIWQSSSDVIHLTPAPTQLLEPTTNPNALSTAAPSSTPLTSPTSTATSSLSPTGTASPPIERNPMHLELKDYLLPISVILAVITILSVLLYRRHRKPLT